jgi:inward rectifier potassium channel
VATRKEPQDLGFGSVLAAQTKLRLMNRDGSFNVRRVSFLQSILQSPYHTLLRVSWVQFVLVLAGAYILTNTVFAIAYLLCGPFALAEGDRAFHAGSFVQAFFFSVETFATIGYGSIVPVTLSANMIVLIESFTSLMGIALATGLIFSRFSRPVPRIIFSDSAVIAPYQGGAGFMFRIANGRFSELTAMNATVILARFEMVRGARTRTFTQLSLERTQVVFFSLSWTVVHPIDATSPLRGLSHQDLIDSEAEFLILLSGTEETFYQTVTARGSYTATEILWGQRFTNIFRPPERDGITRIDLKRLSRVEEAPLPFPDGVLLAISPPPQ